MSTWVLHRGALGDCILLWPLLRALRSRGPVTLVGDLSKARLRFEYEIARDGVRLCTGFTVLAFLDRNAGMRPVRCPDDVEQMMLPTVEPK